MKKEFIIEKQGKLFVKYAGLLDEATNSGLKSIVTAIAQIPTVENGNVGICTASVVMTGPSGDRLFTGIGDAAPNNVAPAMQTCLLRMAETRAKARALRDAINVAMCSLEELGNDDHAESNTQTSRPTANMTDKPVRSVRTGTNQSAPRAARLNTSGGQCPSCFCPDGKWHTINCTAETDARPASAPDHSVKRLNTVLTMIGAQAKNLGYCGPVHLIVAELVGHDPETICGALTLELAQRALYSDESTWSGAVAECNARDPFADRPESVSTGRDMSVYDMPQAAA